MIYVTQGSESGIGTEIFLKAFLLLEKNLRQNIVYIGNSHNLKQTCDYCGFIFSKISNTLIGVNNHKLNFIPATNSSQIVISALNQALSLCRPSDILITLPANKEDTNGAGYTEYLRNKFNNPFLPMSFKSSMCNLLLLTDHCPLSSVAPTLSKDFICFKLEYAINGFQDFFSKLEKVIFLGVNPHAGENGCLGTEESVFYDAINSLKIQFPNIAFSGPLAADSFFLYEKFDRKSLIVSAYHDQLLPMFKKSFGKIGTNITFGLPFLRMTVDHGTAPDLVGKNQADPSSILFLFNLVRLIYADN